MSEVCFRRSLVAAFLLLSLAKMAFHEPWRDELNPWMIALETGSLGEFYGILDYGGHPRLWHTCVWLLALFTDDFRAVQLFQVALASTAVWTFTRLAPFSRMVRGLFAFGYFPLFEYGSICRPYALGMLFVFVACAAFARRPRAPLLLVIPLALLMQTTVYGLMAALALALGWLVDTTLSVRRRREPRPPGGRLVAAGLIFAAALVLSLVQMIPAPDATYAEGWRMRWESALLLRALQGPAAALVPLFRWQVDFWGRHVLNRAPLAFAALGAALLLGPIWLFRRRPAALLAWASGTAACLGFSYLKFSGTLRHHGIFFVLFIACCWLARADPRPAKALARISHQVAAATVHLRTLTRDFGVRLLDLPTGTPPGPKPEISCQSTNLRRLATRPAEKCGPEPMLSRVLGGLLAIHLAAGVAASCVDFALPFSASRDAGRFVRESALNQLPVVGDLHFALTPVTYYLGRPVFFPDWGTFGTFHYFRRGARETGEAAALGAAHELAARSGGEVLLVLSYPLETQPEGVELVRRFDRSIVTSERYHLYLLHGR